MFDRSAAVKLQLRDAKGRFIKMGSHVKWTSLSSGSDVSGIVRGEDGNNVIIEFQHGGKPYTIHVPHTKLNVINEKAQLDAAYVQKMGGHTNTPGINEPGVTPGHAPAAPSSPGTQGGLIKNFATFNTNETTYKVGSADGEKIMSPVSGLKVGDEVFPIAKASTFQKSPYNAKGNGSNTLIQKFGPGVGKVVKVKEGAYATIEDSTGKQWHVSQNHFVFKRDANTEKAVLDAQKMEAATIYAGKTPPSLPWIDGLKGGNAPSAPEAAAPSVPDEPNMPLSDHVGAADMPVGSEIPLGGQQGNATKTGNNNWVNVKTGTHFDDKSAEHIMKTPAPEVLPKDPNTYVSAQKPENPLGDNFTALPPMSTYQKGDVAVLKDGSLGSYVGKGQLELEDGSKVSGNKFSVDGVAKVIAGKDIANVYRPKQNVVTGPANGPFGADAHSYSFDLSKPNNENFKAGDLVVYGKDQNQGKILSVNPTNILVEKLNSDKTVHGTATIVAGQVHGKYVKDKSSSAAPAAEAPSAPSEPASPEAPAAADPNAPIDISKWTKQGGSQMGSNPGGIYTDENGKKWYVKLSQSDDHARTEVLADQLYADSGVAAAGLRLADVGNGKLGTASPMIDGAKADLGHHLDDKPYMEKIQEGFAVDAWLANWDVAGAVYDNIITDGHGDPVRIDPGGALHYRAQGSAKGDAFGNKADEWDSLRNKPGSTSSALFSSMTDQQLVDSAAKVAAFDDKKIDDKVDSLGFDKATADMLKERLKARRDDIVKRADALKPEAAKEPEKAPQAPQTPEESAPAAPAGEDSSAPEDHPTYDALDLFGMPNGAHFSSNADGVKGGYYKKGELWYVSFDPNDTQNGIKVPAHAVVTTLANNPSFKLDPESVKKTSAPTPATSHVPSGESGSGPGTPYYDKLNSTDKAALAEAPKYNYAYAHDGSTDPHAAFPGYNEAESSNVDDFVVDSSGINAALRSGDTAHYNFEIAAMDQVLDKSPLVSDTVVYRGLNARDSIVNNIVAGSYSDAGYSSTSTDPKVGHNWVGFTPTNKTPVFMEIHLPAGFKAHKIDYNAISNGHSYNEESEVVLPHGTVYTVSHKEEYTNADGQKGWKVTMTPILDEHNFDTGDKHDAGANAEEAGHAGGPSTEVHGNGGSDSGVQPGGNEDHAGPVSSPAGAPQEEPAQGEVAPAGPPSYADLHAMPNGTVYSSDGSEGPSVGSIYKKDGQWYISMDPNSPSGGSKMSADAVQHIIKTHPEFKNAADAKAPEAPKESAPAVPNEPTAPAEGPADHPDFTASYPDKGKDQTDSNGNTIKVNDLVLHPKKGVGKVAIGLPSTNSVKVVYKDGSKGVHLSKAVTKVEGKAPELPSLPSDLKVGDSGIDPATHTKYIVGKNNSLIHIGDTVTHQNGDKGTALAIYAGEKNKTVSVKWENGTTSTKKSSVLESESKHGDVQPAAPAEAPAAPTPDATAPEAPAEPDHVPTAVSGEKWGPASKDASELPVGSTLTNPDTGWNLKKIADNQWQESSAGAHVYDDSKVQSTFKYEGSKVLGLPQDSQNAPAAEPQAPEAPTDGHLDSVSPAEDLTPTETQDIADSTAQKLASFAESVDFTVHPAGTSFWAKDGNPLVAAALEHMGIAKNKPVKVSDAEFAKLKDEGHHVIYRGISGTIDGQTPMQAQQDIASSDSPKIGNGLYGGGTYFTNNPDAALHYGHSNGAVSTYALTPDAKMVSMDDIEKIRDDIKAELGDKLTPKVSAALEDVGFVAAMSGFDGIFIPGGNGNDNGASNFYTMLNRGTMAYTDNNIVPSKDFTFKNTDMPWGNTKETSFGKAVPTGNPALKNPEAVSPEAAPEVPQAPEVSPAGVNEPFDGKKLSDVTTPLDQLPVGTKIVADSMPHGFRKLENGQWQAFKKESGNDMFSKFSSAQLKNNLASNGDKYTVNAPVAEEPSNKPEWDGKLFKDFGQTNAATLPVGTELHKTDSNALMRKVGEDKWLVFNKTTGDLMENMPEINNEDFKQMSDMIAGKYIVKAGDGSTVHDPTASAPAEAAAPSGEPDFATMTPDDLAKGSIEDFAKIPVGTEMHKAPGSSSYYQRKVGDNQWQMMKTSNNQPAFANIKNSDKEVHDLLQTSGLYETIKLPDATASEHTAPTASTHDTIHGATPSDLKGLPVGAILTQDGHGTSWTKQVDGSWDANIAGNNVGNYTSDIIGDGDDYKVEIPGSHVTTPDAAASLPSGPVKKDLKEASAQDLHDLPTGAKLTLDHMPNTTWTKNEDGAWSVHDAYSGHAGTVSSELLADGDSYHAEIPDNGGDAPSTSHDGKSLTEVMSSGAFKDLPTGTELHWTGGNGTVVYKKTGPNAWQKTSPQLDPQSNPDNAFDTLPASFTDKYIIKSPSVPAPTSNESAAVSSDHVGTAALTGVSTGQITSKDLLDAQPAGTSMKKESAYGSSAFYYVKQSDGSWKGYKNGQEKATYSSDELKSEHATATIAVPTPGTKFFYSKSGEITYEGDSISYKGDSGKITSITDTGLIAVKLDGESKAKYKSASQLLKSETYGQKNVPAYQPTAAPTVTSTPVSGATTTADFAGASAAAYDQQGLSMPSTSSDAHLSSGLTLTPSHKADPSNPLHGTPEPQPPAAPSAYPAFDAAAMTEPLPKWDSATWLEKVKERYANNPHKVKPTLEESKNWSKIQSVLDGDEIHLDSLLQSQYLDEALKNEAIQGIVAQEHKNKPLLAEHNAKLAEAKKQYDAAKADHLAKYDAQKQEFNQKLAEWAAANPNGKAISAIQLPDTSKESFTGGPADWSKAHAGTFTAQSVFDSIKKDDALGTKGLSIATDSDQVEALDANVMKILDINGKPVLRVKMKLTGPYGDSFEKHLKTQAGVNAEKGIYSDYLVQDHATGLLRVKGKPPTPPAHEGKWVHDGTRYTWTDPSTGAVVQFQRSDNQGMNVSGDNNSVTIHLPENAGPEEYQKVLENMGVNAKPSTEGDIRVLAENQLLSMFGKSADGIKIYDGTKNLGGAERAKQLKEIEDKHGVTANDLTFASEANGRVRFFLNDAKAQKMVDDSGIKGFVHSVSDSYGTDTWVNMLTGPNNGLLSTFHRWNEGIGGKGMSSVKDHMKGSSDYIYTTPQASLPTYGYSVVINPKSIFRRTDWWANTGDDYGKKGIGTSTSPHQTLEDVMGGSKYNYGIHEALPKDSVPVSDWMYVTMGSSTRTAVLAALKEKGVLQINGIPIEDFILPEYGTPPQHANTPII